MKKTEYRLLDSSAWLLYFVAQEQIKRMIESDDIIFTSALSIFEIRRKLMKEEVAQEQVQRVIDFIKSRSVVVDITPIVSENAASFSIEHKLAAIDALIYASARGNNATLITADNDFRGLPGTVVLSA